MKWVPLSCLLLLSACQQASIVQPSQDTVSVAPRSEQPEPPTPRISKQSMVDQLLAQGELALKIGRLSKPLEDNALDRFKAVLMMQPGNRRAEEGLRIVNLTYTEMVREALAKGRLRQAREAMSALETYFPGSPINELVRSELQRAEAVVAKTKQSVPLNEGEEWISLPAAEVAQRTADVEGRLVEIARRISESDQSILIYARNDAEGRWIYKTMSDAVDGFRIRGDIRLNHEPAVKLMAPLK